MAHSLSAKKRVRQNETRRAQNKNRKLQIKDQTKVVNAALSAGDGRSQGQKSDQQCAAELCSCDDEVAETTSPNGRICPQRCRHALRDTGNAAACDDGGRPFHHGWISVITAADRTVPATKAAGIAKASSRLRVEKSSDP